MFDEDITWLCWACIKGSQLEKKKERKRKKKPTQTSGKCIKSSHSQLSPEAAAWRMKGRTPGGSCPAHSCQRHGAGGVTPAPFWGLKGARRLRWPPAQRVLLFSGCALDVAGVILVLLQRIHPVQVVPLAAWKSKPTSAASPRAWLCCVCSFHF